MALHYANGPNPFQGPKKITLIVNGTSRQITLPSTGHVEDVGLLPRHGRAQRRARTRSSSSTTRATTATSTSTTSGSPRRARRATRPRRRTLAGGANAQTEHAGYSGLGYVGGYQNQGANTTFKVNRARRRRGGRHARLRQRPEPVRGHQAREPVRQRRLREEARFTGHGRVEQLPDADRQARPEGRQQRHLVPLRHGRRGQRQPRLPRRQAERADPVRHASTPNDTFDGTTLDKCRWTTILNEDPAGYSRRRRQAADQGAGR